MVFGLDMVVSCIVSLEMVLCRLEMDASEIFDLKISSFDMVGLVMFIFKMGGYKMDKLMIFIFEKTGLKIFSFELVG